ncbi:hypothetical protein, partial [Saccharothrix hoggarensis]
IGDLLGARPHRDDRLPLPADPDADQVRTAFDELGRTAHRLVDELFWWWGEPGECGCPEVVHRLHDDAVRAHAAVLDLEAAPDPIGDGKRRRMWREAAQAWQSALSHTGFWSHVRARVRRLADRSIDSSTVDGLRSAFGRALLNPQVALASTHRDVVLVELLREWRLDADVVADAVVLASQPLVDRMKALLREFTELLDRRDLGVLGRRAQEELPALARQLELALPHRQNPGSARLREQAAVLLNNCALAIADGGRPDVLRVTALLAEAERLAVDAVTKEKVHANLTYHTVLAGLTARTPPTPARSRKQPSRASGGSRRADGRFAEVDRLVARDAWLSAAGVLVRMRRATGDPAVVREIDERLREIRATRARLARPDTSRRSGYLAGAAVFLLHVALVAVLLVSPTIGDWPLFLVVITVGMQAGLASVEVRRRWFLGGPMQWPKAAGVLLVLAGLGALVGASALVGPATVGLTAGAYLVTWLVTSRVCRNAAERSDAR